LKEAERMGERERNRNGMKKATDERERKRRGL
jgi:hypothetical protein